MAVTKGGKGGLGVKFYVFTLSADGTYEAAHTQRLHLRLTPKTAEGENMRVKD